MAAPQAAAIDAHSVAYVRIGRIGRRHGVHGAVVATLDHPESSTLETVRRVVLEDGAGRREYPIRRARRLGRRGVKLELEGVESPEGAEELRGRAILVAERDLPAVGPNEFYDFRAIGCEVVTTQGRRLGTVREIFATRAHDVMIVRAGATEVLIPIIAEVVKNLDFAARRITITAPPGLLD